MKILMIYCERFAYASREKSLSSVPDIREEKAFEQVQLAFIQMEEHDEENPPLKKSANFIKWLRRKHDFDTVILHSFSHLSESKADPDFSARFLDQLQERLENAGFQVFQTPYGYFLDLDIRAPGFSLARVFKSF
jgi:predicted deacetylase